jgi:hypothetical protein
MLCTAPAAARPVRNSHTEVLDAPVGVEEHPCLGPAVVAGVAPSCLHQWGVDRFTQGPADESAATSRHFVNLHQRHAGCRADPGHLRSITAGSQRHHQHGIAAPRGQAKGAHRAKSDSR